MLLARVDSRAAARLEPAAGLESLDSTLNKRSLRGSRVGGAQFIIVIVAMITDVMKIIKRNEI